MVDDPIRDGPTGLTERGSLGLVLAVVVLLTTLAISLLLVPPDRVGLIILSLLAGLAALGVAALFGVASGLIVLAEPTNKQADGVGDLAAEFLESLNDAALIVRKTGEPLRANAAYHRHAGTSPGSRPRTVENLFIANPDASEAVFRLNAAMLQGRRASEEVRMDRGLTGESEIARWYRIRVSPMTSTSEAAHRPVHPELAAWLISDITREREQQENIFQDLQNAIDYLDHAPAGFFSLQPDGRIRYINATLAEWLGLDLSEFEPGAVEFGDLISTEGLSMVQNAVLQPDSGARLLDVDLVSKTGTRVPVRLLHRVPVAPDGTVGSSRTLVLAADDRDGAEAGRLAEMRFNRFFNNTPLAIASVFRDGGLGQTNSQFLSLFAAPGQRPARITDIVRMEDRAKLKVALESASSGQNKIAAVDAAFARDGARSARFFVSPVLDAEDGDDKAIIYALETTEQRALEAQFAQSQKMQAIGQLAGGIAHDFNNVLTAIIGFSDLLLINHRPADPSFQDIMNIKQNANRAAGLVRQLLAFSRQQTLRPQVISLPDVLSDLSVLLDRLLGETLTLDVTAGRELWPVKADVNQLEQVIVNLAVNARDAMPDGGNLKIRAENVSVSEDSQPANPDLPAGEYVQIEVADNGIGMEAEVVDKIFEPFFSTKDVGEGTGLGLSTVYGIVRQTGGYISVESKVGKGTTFEIMLPRHLADEDTEHPPEEASEDNEPKDLTGSETILLVEDEEAVRAFAARALAARGYKVLEATSGAEALDLMKEAESSIDLVVSDVVMPEMDGPTLLGKLRENNPDLKIIFVSGYAEDAFAKHLPEDQDFQFLPKPFSLKELASMVKQTLAEN